MELLESTHRNIEPQKLSDNFIQTIGNDWMLITAGTAEKFNTMTASWGTMGVLWNLPVAICFIRPTRHTYGFAEEADFFTLSFFAPEHKDILKYCGSKSGRDVDKMQATGLIPRLTENKAVGFSQSSLCFECRKIYFDDLDSKKFLIPNAVEKFYPKKDFHRMYIGEITNAYCSTE